MSDERTLTPDRIAQRSFNGLEIDAWSVFKRLESAVAFAESREEADRLDQLRADALCLLLSIRSERNLRAFEAAVAAGRDQRLDEAPDGRPYVRPHLSAVPAIGPREDA